jgi:hypothetical protein
LDTTATQSLTLTSEEAALLTELLRNDFQNLRSEVYRTETYDWQQALKRREALLRGMLTRLGAAEVQPQPGNEPAPS